MERFTEFGNQTAIIWRDQSLSYARILDGVRRWAMELSANHIGAGHVVAFHGEASPNSISLFLALIERGAIAAPLPWNPETESDSLLRVSEADAIVRFGEDDSWSLQRVSGHSNPHPLLAELRSRRRPGLILFSSGSTGEQKAVLLELDRLLDKFARPRAARRTLIFLRLDHIGGVNTLLSTLTAGGTAICVPERDVGTICDHIERYRAELLPTTPTFLRLLLMSDASKTRDLSSLQLITYGTEPMHEPTLRAMAAAFPHARLKQTYGLTELGIFETKSVSGDSLWIKLGGENVEWKVVDGMLWVRSRSAMLGYLNAPSPFDEDGWYNTGDLVEVDGDRLLIRGRKSQIINVGGEKVYPAEVEAELLKVDNVREAVAYGRSNPITGQVVAAKISTKEPNDATVAARALAFCKERLLPFKVPVLIEVSDGPLHGARFKAIRP